jgi:hypothetical protein
MENLEKKTVLEKSTNTHFTNSDVEVVKEIENMTTVVLKTNGNMIVEHGHHNTVATEVGTKDVIKITQQEFNPILKIFNNAFD